MHEYKTFAFKRGHEEGLQPDEFSAYASTFGNVDEGGDIVQQGAFTATLPAFLQDGLVCWQHDWRTPIGKPLEAREDGYGLFVKAHVSDTQMGRDALTLMRDDVVKKVSIGYDVEGYRMLSDDEGRALLGEGAYDAAVRSLPWWQDKIRVLTQLKLYEYSPVSVPMNPLARITGVKHPAGGDQSALDGLTMAEQYEALLLAERDYLTRLKGLATLRAKEGRVLSDANRTKLQTMRESLQVHITTLDDLLVASERVSLAAEGADDAKTHPSPDAALALAARQQLLRFQQMEAHLHGAL